MSGDDAPAAAAPSAPVVDAAETQRLVDAGATYVDVR